ncbi:hypothetical protein [Phenylobacterium sp.]|uniref:DUF7662 domain-containing protein n=1 Tax=Phenylobacterium sp. TaxID=1871053 RepID=UPI002731B688|nr:hypothetical protein [Phenylobacterium sp.]MDP1601608.1 hypothetical protein [Phenylobacterium sp.]MDP3595022.1 hypothetical protein [Phenylobacterium sp.]
MSKYRPLSDRLSLYDGDEWRATFAEIEGVLGSSLPKAAQQAAWWIGTAEKPHQRVWLDHGWRVADVDKVAGVVTFRRDLGGQEATPATSIVEAVSEVAAKPDQAKLALGAPALIGGAVALVAGLGVFAVKMLKGRET